MDGEVEGADVDVGRRMTRWSGQYDAEEDEPDEDQVGDSECQLDEPQISSWAGHESGAGVVVVELPPTVSSGTTESRTSTHERNRSARGSP